MCGAGLDVSLSYDLTASAPIISRLSLVDVAFSMTVDSLLIIFALDALAMLFASAQQPMLCSSSCSELKHVLWSRLRV